MDTTTATTLIPAYGYIRVSSNSQADEHRDGPTRQRFEIETWAAAHGFTIVSWFEDSISGKIDGEDRPAFVEMLAAIHADGVRTVIIERLDRLARTMRVQETLIHDFTKAGVTLISTKEPDLGSEDIDRIMIRQIIGAVNQHTAAALVAKLKGARKRAKAKRPDYREGRVPFGYRVVKQDGIPVRVPEATEQETIERIRHLHEVGRSLKQIADQLTAEGRRPRACKQWHISSIGLILSRA
jgi:DNA invertase Pin-like site-specific DNA recombinase